MRFLVNHPARAWMHGEGIHHMDPYYAIAGRWQFVIVYDHLLDAWSATWSELMHRNGTNYLGDNLHPSTKLPYFETRGEAEQACKDQFDKLTKGST